ncbi:MAG: hypothetical protein ACP5D2_03420 [Candidatus Nanoarchaeia archaeon]
MGKMLFRNNLEHNSSEHFDFEDYVGEDVILINSKGTTTGHVVQYDRGYGFYLYPSIVPMPDESYRLVENGLPTFVSEPITNIYPLPTSTLEAFLQMLNTQKNRERDRTIK